MEEGWLERVVPIALIAAYGIGCAAAASNGWSGITTLAIISTLITLPFFAKQFIIPFAGGHMVIGCLLIVGMFIPGINILILIWMFIGMMMKFANLVRALPFILAGCILYWIAYAVPPFLFGALSSGGVNPAFASILIGIGGGSLFYFFVKTAVGMGASAALSSALALGFLCYTVLFAIFMFLPGHGGIDFDGDFSGH